MKLEGIQYESSLFLALSFFLFLQTVAHRDVRAPAARPPSSRHHGTTERRARGQKGKSSSRFGISEEKTSSLARPSDGEGGGENIPRACRYILKRAETFVSESETSGRRTADGSMDLWGQMEDETGSLHFCCTAKRYAAADKKK